MRQQVQDLGRKCQERNIAFEGRCSVAKIVATTDGPPSGFIENAIKQYQSIIRGNSWYFPSLKDVSVSEFLERWGLVHSQYLNTAERIFSRLSESGSLNVLCDADLLDTVIRSETMRGWVGKRSPSGLDSLLNDRVGQLEEILQCHFDVDTADDLLSEYGVFGSTSFVSAETEVVRLFEQYRKEVGLVELTPSVLPKLASTGASMTLLRGFCRYSIIVTPKVRPSE